MTTFVITGEYYIPEFKVIHPFDIECDIFCEDDREEYEKFVEHTIAHYIYQMIKYSKSMNRISSNNYNIKMSPIFMLVLDEDENLSISEVMEVKPETIEALVEQTKKLPINDCLY